MPESIDLAPRPDGAAVSRFQDLAQLQAMLPSWGGELVGARAEPVGTGQMASSMRLHLTYANPGAPGPRTLVAKLPADDPRSRRSGAGKSGFYAREVNFYNELAASACARIPDCYHADLDPVTGDFTLLLEDLAPAQPGDQLAGLTVADAELALAQAAKLHASHWNDDSLEAQTWLVGADTAPPRWSSAPRMSAMWDAFLTRYGDQVSSAVRTAGDRLMKGYDRFLAHRDERRCLIHNDFRPDNLLFGVAQGARAVWLVDWQTVGVGCGAADVAYLLGGALAPELRQAEEARLLALYLSGLHDAGVQDYAAADLDEDYARNSFHPLLTAVTGATIVQQTERGDAMFLRMIEGAADQVTATGALDLL